MPDIDYIDLALVESTDINETKAIAVKGQQFYNLQGQKVNDSNAHGIVVSDDGKKYVK